VLTMTRHEGRRTPSVGGPEVRLDKLIDCACSISMDKLMSVLYRNEWMRNNPGKMTGQLLTILADPEVLRVAARIIALYMGTRWKKF